MPERILKSSSGTWRHSRCSSACKLFRLTLPIPLGGPSCTTSIGASLDKEGSPRPAHCTVRTLLESGVKGESVLPPRTGAPFSASLAASRAQHRRAARHAGADRRRRPAAPGRAARRAQMCCWCLLPSCVCGAVRGRVPAWAGACSSSKNNRQARSARSYYSERAPSLLVVNKSGQRKSFVAAGVVDRPMPSALVFASLAAAACMLSSSAAAAGCCCAAPLGSDGRRRAAPPPAAAACFITVVCPLPAWCARSSCRLPPLGATGAPRQEDLLCALCLAAPVVAALRPAADAASPSAYAPKPASLRAGGYRVGRCLLGRAPVR